MFPRAIRLLRVRKASSSILPFETFDAFNSSSTIGPPLMTGLERVLQGKIDLNNNNILQSFQKNNLTVVNKSFVSSFQRGVIVELEEVDEESLLFNNLNMENLAEDVFFAQHRPLGIGSLPPLVLDISQDDDYQDKMIPSIGGGINAPLYMINILKRRRKKMNKHKWKKYRREVRNSTRYNPERIRKKKKMKKRGLVL